MSTASKHLIATKFRHKSLIDNVLVGKIATDVMPSLVCLLCMHGLRGYGLLLIHLYENVANSYHIASY